MTEQALTRPRPAARLNPITLWQRLLSNPVAVKELRSRMRGRRAFVVLVVYLLLMSGLISLVYGLYAAQAQQPYGPEQKDAGKAVFAAVLAVQVFLVVFVGPAFTAGSISGEKERQTYDLLRTTLLTPRALVLGKLVSSLAYVLLLVIASVPLQSVAFLLGGIDWIELVVSQTLIVLSAVAFALVGLYASARMRSTLSASVLTYGLTLLLVAGVPVLALFTLPFLSFIFGGVSSPPPWAELAMILTGLGLASTNLPLTLIISEVFLLQENALFYFRTGVASYNVIFPSPWTVYLLLYCLLTWLLYRATLRRVRRVAVQ